MITVFESSCDTACWLAEKELKESKWKTKNELFCENLFPVYIKYYQYSMFHARSSFLFSTKNWQQEGRNLNSLNWNISINDSLKSKIEDRKWKFPNDNSLYCKLSEKQLKSFWNYQIWTFPLLLFSNHKSSKKRQFILNH
jgi:hypothetical protein